MNKSKIIGHAGVYFDLSKVKCFKLSPFTGTSKDNTLIIEFLIRTEFLFHPAVEEWGKEVYNDTVEIEFPDYETAKQYTKEWAEIWQDYLVNGQ